MFSLLELASDGALIPVDYNMALVELMYLVVKAKKRVQCLCYIARVCWLLGVGNEPIDKSVPIVYAQWEEQDRECRCSYLKQVHLKQAEWGAAMCSLGSRDQAQQQFIQVPAQHLLRVLVSPGVRMSDMCQGSRISIPVFRVKLGLGLVHDRKTVTEGALD